MSAPGLETLEFFGVRYVDDIRVMALMKWPADPTFVKLVQSCIQGLLELIYDEAVSLENDAVLPMSGFFITVEENNLAWRPAAKQIGEQVCYGLRGYQTLALHTSFRPPAIEKATLIGMFSKSLTFSSSTGQMVSAIVDHVCVATHQAKIPEHVVLQVLSDWCGAKFKTKGPTVFDLVRGEMTNSGREAISYTEALSAPTVIWPDRLGSGEPSLSSGCTNSFSS